MAATVIDGTAVAARIREAVAEQVRGLAEEGARPRLTAVLVGEPPAGRLYAASQQRHCDRVGIAYTLDQLPATITQAALIDHVHDLNRDPAVTGIMLHLPVPEGIDPAAVQFHIDPYKDVEGVNPANIGLVFYGKPIIAPCTALAVVELIHETGVTIRGAQVVVVGQSEIAGKPITLFLLQEMATVTGCHVATVDLAAHTRRADILIVAVGKAGLITADYVNPGAVVIDVGINRVQRPDGHGGQTTVTVGDVDYDTVVEQAGFITPVPGGVGPVTVATLLKNTVEAVEKQRAAGGGQRA